MQGKDVFIIPWRIYWGRLPVWEIKSRIFFHHSRKDNLRLYYNVGLLGQVITKSPDWEIIVFP